MRAFYIFWFCKNYFPLLASDNCENCSKFQYLLVLFAKLIQWLREPSAHLSSWLIFPIELRRKFVILLHRRKQLVSRVGSQNVRRRRWHLNLLRNRVRNGVADDDGWSLLLQLLLLLKSTQMLLHLLPELLIAQLLFETATRVASNR